MRIAFLFISLAFSSIAIAYCPSYPSVEKEFSESELVFTGKVLSEEKANVAGDYYDGIFYKIEVNKIFKGNPGNTVIIFSENSSGRFSMSVGESYLVFTSIETEEFVKNQYAISYCGNSGQLAEKKEVFSSVVKLVESSPNKALKEQPSAAEMPQSGAPY